MIQKLISIANKLDTIGEYELSGQVDCIIKVLAETSDYNAFVELEKQLYDQVQKFISNPSGARGVPNSQVRAIQQKVSSISYAPRKDKAMLLGPWAGSVVKALGWQVDEEKLANMTPVQFAHYLENAEVGALGDGILSLIKKLSEFGLIQ